MEKAIDKIVNFFLDHMNVLILISNVIAIISLIISIYKATH